MLVSVRKGTGASLKDRQTTGAGKSHPTEQTVGERGFQPREQGHAKWDLYASENVPEVTHADSHGASSPLLSHLLI